jgi:hypothetical protein
MNKRRNSEIFCHFREVYSLRCPNALKYILFFLKQTKILSHSGIVIDIDKTTPLKLF